MFNILQALLKNSIICNSRPWFDSWVRKIRWRRDRLPTPVFLGFPDSSVGKESTCNAGDLGSIPGLGRSPGEGKGYPLHYSGLENATDCYSPWGHKELDMTEQLWLWLSLFQFCRTSEILKADSRVWVDSQMLLSRVQLCVPMDCSLPGSSVHGILQARILEWAAISFSRESSWPGDRTLHYRQILYHLSHQGSQNFTSQNFMLFLFQ